MPSKQIKSAKDFLNKTFIDNTLWANMEPELQWLTMFPRMPTDAKAISYKVQDYNAYTDPKKQKPARRVSSTKFPRITISELSEEFARMEGEGYEVEIDQDILDYPDELDDFDRAINYLGAWMAEHINAKILSTMIANVHTETTGDALYDNKTGGSANPVWSEDGAKYLADLTLFRRDFNRIAKPYKLSDIFLYDENWAEYSDSLINTGVSMDVYKDLGGGFDFNSGKITIPRLGVTLHEVTTEEGAIPEGAMLGLSSTKGAEIGTLYYAQTGNKYLANPTTGAGRNVVGLHTKIFENDNGNYVIRVWAKYAFTVKRPNYGLYLASGI